MAVVVQRVLQCLQDAVVVALVQASLRTTSRIGPCALSLRVALPGRVVIQVPIDDERSMARVKQAQAGAIRRIADQLGVHPETSRGWAKRAETDAGDRPGTTSSDADASPPWNGRIVSCGGRTRS